MKVPIVSSCQETGEILDKDLIEALGYFVEDMETPMIKSTKFQDGNKMDAMLFSLEHQEFVSSTPQETIDKKNGRRKEDGTLFNMSLGQQQQQEQQQRPEKGLQSGLKKVDRRQRPNSTSKRHHRRRPKHELEYLRAKVRELEEKLETVTKAHVNAINKSVALAAIDTTIGCLSWKEHAERQKHEVAISINENRKLRDRLLRQLYVARVLEAAIRQHQVEAGTYDLLTSTGICRVRRPLMNKTDEQIFALLNSQLEQQFDQVDGVDGVFTTHGLSSVLRHFQGGFDFKREENGTSFRHEEARLLPFPLQSLHNAIWSTFHNGLAGKDTKAKVLDNDRSNLIMRGTIELSTSHRVCITKRAAFRRHLEQDRVVFVWSSFVQIDGSVSIRLREKGWSCASTFELHRGVTQGSSSSSNFERGCITRMTVQLVPEVSKFKSEQEAEEITDLIVDTYHHDFGLVHEVAETLFLKDADTTDNNKGSPLTSVVCM